MIRRFASDLSVFTFGAFLAFASEAFAADTTRWWLLALGLITMALGAMGLMDRARGEAHRAMDGAMAVLGLWAVVLSFAWDGSTLVDLTLITGIAMAIVGAVGLVIHELRTERVVHALEVSAPAARREDPLVHH